MLPWYVYPNSIWREVLIMQLFIIQCVPDPCWPIPLRPSYLPRQCNHCGTELRLNLCAGDPPRDPAPRLYDRARSQASLSPCAPAQQRPGSGSLAAGWRTWRRVPLGRRSAGGPVHRAHVGAEVNAKSDVNTRTCCRWWNMYRLWLGQFFAPLWYTYMMAEWV